MRSCRSKLFVGPMLLAHVLNASGCYTRQLTPIQPIPDPMPDRLVVFQWDGTRHTLENPRIEGDSIRGDGAPAIALADVGSVERRTFSGRNTLSLVSGVVAGVAIAWLIDFIDDLGDWGDGG